LRPEGLFVFAIHNPEYVKLNLLKKTGKYQNFNSLRNPLHGKIVLDGVKIPIYIRNSLYYTKLLNNLGLKKILEYYPPFNHAYLSRFPDQKIKISKYLLLGFQK